MLKQILNIKTFDQFREYAIKYHGFEDLGSNMLFKDNGGPVLGVAHLDWVMFSPSKKSGHYVKCPQLDDRLGVWVLLSLLPDLGCSDYDILLTDDEEIGQSTAQFFKPQKDYNWFFEFDRAGPKDCALYEYYDKDTADLVRDYGWSPTHGSYTDICYLSDHGAKAFNFAVGYVGQHTSYCYADLRHTSKSAERFVKFHQDLSETHLPHESRKFNHSHNNYWYSGTYEDSYSDYLVTSDDFCHGCGDDLKKTESVYCKVCASEYDIFLEEPPICLSCDVEGQSSGGLCDSCIEMYESTDPSILETYDKLHRGLI